MAELVPVMVRVEETTVTERVVNLQLPAEAVYWQDGTILAEVEWHDFASYEVVRVERTARVLERTHPVDRYVS